MPSDFAFSATARPRLAPGQLRRRRRDRRAASTSAAASPRSATGSCATASWCTRPASASGRVGGPAPDERTVFRIASMSKSFTASAVLLLRDAGALRLDDPAAAYVPELAGWVNGAADAGPLTIRHLLTMTAGLPTDDPWGDRQQGLPHRRLPGPAGARRAVQLGPRDPLRVLQPRLRRPRAGGRRRLRDALRRVRPDPAAGPARDDQDRVRGGGVPRGRARRRLPAPARRLGGAAVRPLRRVRPDGRGVLHRGRPGHLVGRLRRRVPARRRGQPTGRRRRTRWPRRPGGRCSCRRCPPAGGRRTASPAGRPAAPAYYGFGLFVDEDPALGPGRQPQRRLPRLRVQHALAPGDRAGRHRARQRHLLAHVGAGRAGAAGAARPARRRPRRRLALAPRRPAAACGPARPGRRPWRPPTRCGALLRELGRRAPPTRCSRERGPRPAVRRAAGRPGPAARPDRPVHRRTRPARPSPTPRPTAAGGWPASGARWRSRSSSARSARRACSRSPSRSRRPRTRCWPGRWPR